MSQHQIWGVFDNQVAAGEALSLLESGGFGQSQIAIEKRFREALSGFVWSQILYVRLPEGIVLGFAGGGLLCALICVLASRGMPPVFPAAAFICVGSVVGTILGACAGMVVAKLESNRLERENQQDRISIGVLCTDPVAEAKAKFALQKAGAATIDIGAAISL